MGGGMCRSVLLCVLLAALARPAPLRRTAPPGARGPRLALRPAAHADHQRRRGLGRPGHRQGGPLGSGSRRRRVGAKARVAPHAAGGRGPACWTSSRQGGRRKRTCELTRVFAGVLELINTPERSRVIARHRPLRAWPEQTRRQGCARTASSSPTSRKRTRRRKARRKRKTSLKWDKRIFEERAGR